MISYVNSTDWFVDCCFEVSSLDFGHHHLVFLEPEVTIFGREACSLAIPDTSTELVLRQQLKLAIAD